MTNQSEKSSSARLIINNIGNLKYADITIDDNCVIAGHNNIGKSTITKILYSIIKTEAMYEKLSEEIKNNIEGLSDKEQLLEIKKFQNKYAINFRDYNLKTFISNLRWNLYETYISRYLNSTLGKNIKRFSQKECSFIFMHKDFTLNYSYSVSDRVRGLETGITASIGETTTKIDITGDYQWFKDATLI